MKRDIFSHFLLYFLKQIFTVEVALLCNFLLWKSLESAGLSSHSQRTTDLKFKSFLRIRQVRIYIKMNVHSITFEKISKCYVLPK